jgi:hypothetical protein
MIVTFNLQNIFMVQATVASLTIINLMTTAVICDRNTYIIQATGHRCKSLCT